MNTAGRGGETPLHAAAMAGNADSASLLLIRGADPLRKNAAGETPLDLARRGVEQGMRGGGAGAGKIVEVLERAAAEAAVVAAATKKSVPEHGRGRYRGEGNWMKRLCGGDETFYFFQVFHAIY